MEGNLARVIATTVIWGAFAIVMGIVSSSMTEGNLLVLGGILTLATAGATVNVWMSGRAANSQDAAAAAEKAKRTGSARVSRFVESLSDEELDQLRARLEARDETVPLESLLSQKDSQRR